MSGKSDGPDYASPLLEMARPKPKKKRRPKALHGGKATELRPHQRHLGQLLKDIAQISVRYPKLTRGFFKQLAELPAYQHISSRTLRRDVAEALAHEENILKQVPPQLWPKLLGIEPPATLSKQTLRKKALEALRQQLQRQQLLAKTR